MDDRDKHYSEGNTKPKADRSSLVREGSQGDIEENRQGGIAALMAKHAKKKEMSFYPVPIE